MTAPLLVFSDDWGRHPSSCQHLIRQLLARRAVTWVNTVGTRPPGLNWHTLTRGLGKLRQWVAGGPTPPTPLPEGKGEKSLPSPLAGEGGESSSRVRGDVQGSEELRRTAEASAPSPGREARPPSPARGEGKDAAPRVLNPKMWPSFRSRLARRLNRRLLSRALAPVANAAPPVVVTTLPITADLVGAFPAVRWVYYCVDDFAVWPGLDGRTLRDMEAELVPKVDVAVAVSATLQTHLAKLGKPAHLLTHGVDLDFWRIAPGALPPSLAVLDTLPKPLAVYWGVIDRRTDLDFVRALSSTLTEGTILFAGPQDDPDPALLKLPRVRTLPPLPFADLPALAARADVLVAPYADLPVTRAMQPLKLKEYLATGKPVVVRHLPATAEWADGCDVVETAEAFASAVVERARSGMPAAQVEGRARLASEGWAAKAAQFERWLDGE